jgi:hypothetical protein
MIQRMSGKERHLQWRFNGIATEHDQSIAPVQLVQA